MDCCKNFCYVAKMKTTSSPLIPTLVSCSKNESLY